MCEVSRSVGTAATEFLEMNALKGVSELNYLFRIRKLVECWKIHYCLLKLKYMLFSAKTYHLNVACSQAVCITYNSKLKAMIILRELYHSTGQLR